MQQLLRAPPFWGLVILYVKFVPFNASINFFQPKNVLICHKQLSEGFQLNAFTLDYCAFRIKEFCSNL